MVYLDSPYKSLSYKLGSSLDDIDVVIVNSGESDKLTVSVGSVNSMGSICNSQPSRIVFELIVCLCFVNAGQRQNERTTLMIVRWQRLV